MVDMDLTYPADAEEFRVEIRAWLEENLPDGWFDDDFEMTDDERRQFNQEWPQKLFEGGWICATWPAEYGGKGLTTMQGVVLLAEEFARAEARRCAATSSVTRSSGRRSCSGAPRSRSRSSCRRSCRARPAGVRASRSRTPGSDLASIYDTAVLDGDEWVINGQKVWTTQGHHADYCFLLTRTDP